MVRLLRPMLRMAPSSSSTTLGPWHHSQPAGGLRGQEAVPIEITAGAVFNLVIPVGFIGVDVQDQFATAARPECRRRHLTMRGSAPRFSAAR